MSALRRSNNNFTDLVVCPSGEALFFLASSFKQATRGLRTFGLKLAPKLTVAIANVLNRLALLDSAVTVYRNIGDAQVNTKKTLNIKRRGLINVADSEQIELTVDISKVGFALLGLQQLPLMFTADKGDYLTTRHRPNRYGMGRQAPVQYPIIVGNAAAWLKRSLRFLVQLVGVRYFGDATDHQLRRQPALLADGVIGDFVKVELTESLCIPSLLTDLITGGISRLKGYFEQVSLFFGRLQLHFGGQFHRCIVLQ